MELPERFSSYWAKNNLTASTCRESMDVIKQRGRTMRRLDYELPDTFTMSEFINAVEAEDLFTRSQRADIGRETPSIYVAIDHERRDGRRLYRKLPGGCRGDLTIRVRTSCLSSQKM